MAKYQWVDEAGNFDAEEFSAIIGTVFKFIAVDDPVESEGRTTRTWTFIPSGPEWKHASDNDRVWPPAYIDAEYTVVEKATKVEPLTQDQYIDLEAQRIQHAHTVLRSFPYVPMIDLSKELREAEERQQARDNGYKPKWYYGLERQRAHHVSTIRPNKRHNRTRRLL